jgi:hypothetical protein
MKSVVSERKMKVDYGTKEWVTCILITFSKSTKEKQLAVREIPQITKPTNTFCKHCQQGKKTKTRFKSKEYSTTKPLEIMHTELVGPTTIKGLKGER